MVVASGTVTGFEAGASTFIVGSWPWTGVGSGAPMNGFWTASSAVVSRTGFRVGAVVVSLKVVVGFCVVTDEVVCILSLKKTDIHSCLTN